MKEGHDIAYCFVSDTRRWMTIEFLCPVTRWTVSKYCFPDSLHISYDWNNSYKSVPCVLLSPRTHFLFSSTWRYFVGKLGWYISLDAESRCSPHSKTVARGGRRGLLTVIYSCYYDVYDCWSSLALQTLLAAITKIVLHGKIVSAVYLVYVLALNYVQSLSLLPVDLSRCWVR